MLVLTWQVDDSYLITKNSDNQVSNDSGKQKYFGSTQALRAHKET